MPKHIDTFKTILHPTLFFIFKTVYLGIVFIHNRGIFFITMYEIERYLHLCNGYNTLGDTQRYRYILNRDKDNDTKVIGDRQS